MVLARYGVADQVVVPQEGEASPVGEILADDLGHAGTTCDVANDLSQARVRFQRVGRRPDRLRGQRRGRDDVTTRVVQSPLHFAVQSRHPARIYTLARHTFGDQTSELEP